MATFASTHFIPTSHHATSSSSSSLEGIAMSAATATTTAALTSRLYTLRAKSSQLSSELLTKLTSTSSTSRHDNTTTTTTIHKNSSSSSTTSGSGGGGSSSSLLHMASTISSIVPPQLTRLDHDLLRPLHVELEDFQQGQKATLDSLNHIQKELQDLLWKEQDVHICQGVYDDLHFVSKILETHTTTTNTKTTATQSSMNQSPEHLDIETKIYRIVLLERASHVIHSLLQQVSIASEQVRQWTTSSSFTNHTSSSSSMMTSGMSTSSHHHHNQQQQQQRKSEASQFILKLAPTIRQVKEQLTQVLLQDLEYFLIQHNIKDCTTSMSTWTDQQQEQQQQDTAAGNHDTSETINTHSSSSSSSNNKTSPSLVLFKKKNLLILGHLFRSLTLLQEVSAAERIFVKIVTMPIIRLILLPNSSSSTTTNNNNNNTVLMVSKLDQGGPRGECTGLSSFLNEIISTLKNQYGDLLIYLEDMFHDDSLVDTSIITTTNLEGDDSIQSLPKHISTATTTKTMSDLPTTITTPVVDLITMGIWMPLATVLTADPAMKMAIFSPGIAHVLQANYTTLDKFITNLASSLFGSTTTVTSSSLVIPSEKKEEIENLEAFYYDPKNLTSTIVQKTQQRILSHGTTIDFYKKFNLPIYYQLRFAELTTRVNTVLDRIRMEGWKTTTIVHCSSSTSTATSLLQLPIFLEIQDCLVWMWSSQVYLKPMTHRFLRGVVQVLGRFLSFIKDGLDGKILFGTRSHEEEDSDGSNNDNNANEGLYKWVDRMDDVAVVSSDAAVLHSWIVGDYLQVIQRALSTTTDHSTTDNAMDCTVNEMVSVCREVLLDASQDLELVVKRAWDDIITDALIKKCVGPIAAVKGIAATFRMTNRPAPTLASPFVATILRSLKEFDSVNGTRVPPIIGSRWKERVVNSVAEKYSSSVGELIETVQKTEEALKNRKGGRKTAASGLSDGDKVKMQLYLDSQEFLRQVQQLNLDPTSSIEGLKVLLSLTEDGKVLFEKGSSS